MGCDVCGNDLVHAMGPIKSPLLLLGAYPGEEEVAEGMPWVGKAGEILKYELQLAGIAWGTARVTNMWMHIPPPAKSDIYEACMSFNITQMMKELQGRVAVLLMGTDPVNFFTGHGSADLSGLDVTGMCQLMPKSVKLVVASVNPAQSLKGGAGEVRFAIQKFARLSKEMR